MRLRLTAAIVVPVLALLAAGCSAATPSSPGAGAAGSDGTGTGSTGTGSAGGATIPQLTIGDDGG